MSLKPSAGRVEVITLPTPFAIGPVNCYVLRGEPLTLIDPGPNSSEALVELEAGLERLELGIEQVELVLLTHQHLDHFGLAATVRERSGCAVAMHELLAGYLTDFPSAHAAEDDYQAEVMRLNGVPTDVIETLRDVSRAYRRFGATVEADRVLRSGDEIVAGGATLRVGLRPGHSPTDTIFVEEAEQVAFLGDHLISTISSNPVAHRPLDHEPDPRQRSSALLTYLRSLEQTAALELTLAYSGHREPITDHRALIAERLSHHVTRVERVFEHLADGPLTAYEIARAIWGEVALRQAYLTLSEVLGAIDVLCEQGRIAELDAGEPLRYSVARG